MAYDPSAAWPTLSELTKQLDNSGKLAPVAQILNETNPILDDMPFYEANETTSHTHVVDASLPEGTWRKLNYGIKPVKGTTAQVSDTIGLLEGRAECDIVLARMSRDPSKFRMNEDRRFLEGLNQQMADMFFYGSDVATPEGFLGLAPRYDVLGQPANKPAANTQGMDHVLDLKGNTANKQSSIYLVGWGENSVFGIYPKGSPAGLERQDLGEIDLHDENGGVFRGYATHYRIQQGLAVKDWRYVVRIANVEVGAIIDEAAINTIIDAMLDATNAIPHLGSCRPCFYMNRLVRSRLEKAMYRKSNMALNMGDIYGTKNTLNISGIPLKTSDALLSTEAVVTA